jgi:hypothetical protein
MRKPFQLAIACGCVLLASSPAGEARGRAPLPTLSIGSVTVAEPDSGTATAHLTVRLSRATSKTVRVCYHTKDATATGGQDYVPTHGVVVFKARQTRAEIDVSVLSDSIPEDNETFLVLLSGAKNARVKVATAGVRIPYNDLPPTFTEHANLTTEASASARGFITVTCDPAAASVSYTLSVSGLPVAPDHGGIGHALQANGTAAIQLFSMPSSGDGSSSGTAVAGRGILIQMYTDPAQWGVIVTAPNLAAYTLEGILSRP